MNLFYFANIHVTQSEAATGHTLEVCNHLAQRGHTVWLFVPYHDEPSPIVLCKNVHIIPVSQGYFSNRLLKSIFFYIMLPWVSWTYFRREHPAFVYTRASFLDFIAILPLRMFFDFIYVAELNGIRSLETSGHRLKRIVIMWFEYFSLRLSDKVICVTPELGTWAIKHGKLHKEQVSIIGNGVSTEIFYPMPIKEACQQVGLDCSKRYLNFTSSLKRWHGTQLLIEALPQILNEFPDVHLLIVGDGPEKRHLSRLATRLNVIENIKWIGSVSIEKVPYYINASEICLAPFVRERNLETGISPIKIFEYMACARPFISTRIGTTYDFMVESCDCGLLVPPNDATALASAVLHLLRNPRIAKRMGQNGFETAKEHYSWEKISKQIEQFLLSPPHKNSQEPL